ncbi:MAG: AraC family transcriptional regulator [Methylacidiphilales bacterium]|nr:AraC family transcriptional regulator [Candidatus Methylacidiphilales bacterium]
MTILRWDNIAGQAAFHAARHSKNGPQSTPYHGHDFAEIFWINAGHGIHRVNDVSFPLQPGSLILMRPTDCHGIHPTGPDALELTNIAFPRETLDFLHSRYFRGRKWAFSPSEKYPAAQQIEPSRLRRFNRWADELSQSPRERLYLERFLLNLLAELRLSPKDASLDDAPDWLARACQAIQNPNHFSEGVGEFLRLCGRSREHVARTVRHHLGMTPTDYVNGVRLAYAKRQLEMGDQGILHIALDCGIENLSHFYSLFRSRTGTTPRRYRLSHRKLL